MPIQKNISLKSFNTFGIDAKAKFFAEINSKDDFLELIRGEELSKYDILILGGGSNVLFTQNFNGLVLKINTKGIELTQEDDEFVYIKAQAGEIWHNLVMYCVQNKFAGIENLSLIPGCCGAAPIQNIGAYGVELKDVLFQVEVMNLKNGEVISLSNHDCKFGYRDSIFKSEAKGKYFVLAITLKLSKKPKYQISYGTIEQELEQMGVQDLSISAISEAVCNIRRSKLPDPLYIGNAGSFFKNPVISKEKFDSLKEQFQDIPSFIKEEQIKIPAAWLIEKAGWKGKRFGNYGVHEKQPLVLVNYGNAEGNDIYNLSEEIIQNIAGIFDIQLEREVNIL